MRPSISASCPFFSSSFTFRFPLPLIKLRAVVSSARVRLMVFRIPHGRRCDGTIPGITRLTLRHI